MLKENKKRKMGAFHLWMAALRDAKEYNEMLKKLELAALDYGFLQQAIDRAKDVKITISRPDGYTLTIEPRSELEQAGYKPFAEKWNEAKKNR